MQNGGFRSALSVLEFHPALSRRNFFVLLQQKKKRRIAGGNLVSMLQPLFVHGSAIHQGAVAAIEVADPESSVLPGKQTMFSRDRGVHDCDAIGRLSPNRDFALG